MNHPRFSVVVPTRHRPHTLRHALATIVNQNHDSFEIVVADNASGPETRALVEQMADPRVVYLRSDVPLTMSANWERALAACRGEWITFIGDDDGLMPEALAECDAVISAHAVRSIRQQYAIYIWPCADSISEANRLQVHLGRSVRLESGRQALKTMAAQPDGAPIPLPYHGWIHRSLYKKGALSGPIFQGTDPDVYAGILLAALTEEFVSQDRPLSVMGISGTSNTLRNCILNRPGEVQRDGEVLDSAAGNLRHPLVPDVPCIPAVIYDGLLKISDRLGGNAIPVCPTVSDIARKCAAKVWRTDSVGESQIALIRDKLSRPEDLRDFDAAVATSPPLGLAPRMCVDPNERREYLVTDTFSLGVRTVADAAIAAASILAAAQNYPTQLNEQVTPHLTPKRSLAKKVAKLSDWFRRCRI